MKYGEHYIGHMIGYREDDRFSIGMIVGYDEKIPHVPYRVEWYGEYHGTKLVNYTLAQIMFYIDEYNKWTKKIS
jgi:hypothetical protein